MRHIIVVMDRQLREQYFYIGRCTFDRAKQIACIMLENNLRTFIKTLYCDDDVSFWYKCGRRKFPIAPPKKYAYAYALGQLIKWKPGKDQ